MSPRVLSKVLLGTVVVAVTLLGRSSGATSSAAPVPQHSIECWLLRKLVPDDPRIEINRSPGGGCFADYLTEAPTRRNKRDGELSVWKYETASDARQAVSREVEGKPWERETNAFGDYGMEFLAGDYVIGNLIYPRVYELKFSRGLYMVSARAETREAEGAIRSIAQHVDLELQRLVEKEAERLLEQALGFPESREANEARVRELMGCASDDPDWAMDCEPLQNAWQVAERGRELFARHIGNPQSPTELQQEAMSEVETFFAYAALNDRHGEPLYPSMLTFGATRVLVQLGVRASASRDSLLVLRRFRALLMGMDSQTWGGRAP